MKKYSLLIVDDEHAILELLNDIFENTEYDVRLEHNPVKALEILDDKKFDLVISDLMMPEVSGLQVLSKVIETHPETGTIILTGHASVESAAEAIDSGVDAYLQKPVNPMDILETAKKVIKTKQTCSTAAKGLKTISDLSSLLYQVNDMNLALDMILDTCTEYLNMKQAGIAVYSEKEDKFQIVKHKDMDSYLPVLKFNLSDDINGRPFQSAEPFKIEGTDGEIAISGNPVKIDSAVKELHIFPVRFHEKTLAFLIMPVDDVNYLKDNKILELIKTFVNQISPVFFSSEWSKKSWSSYENIISKIIKDRVYESRLILNPISFALVRIVAKDKFDDSLVLENAIRTYQSTFINMLDKIGDLIWLTADTVFLIYPNADLFKIESITSDLKNEIERISINEETHTAFTLKYACMSYPQSGEHAAEIISNLWLKLFDEIYFMQN